MSNIERNSVRAAYIHKAEYLGERRLMLQWWADYLDANLQKGGVHLILGNWSLRGLNWLSYA